MFLALSVILHLFLVLEYLLAELAPVLLDCNLLVLASLDGFLLLPRVPLSHLLPVLPKSLLIFLPLPRLLLLLLLSFSVLLSLLSQLELLIPRVSLLDPVQQPSHCVVELLPLLLALFLVLGLYETLYATIRGRVRVVLVCIRKLLQCLKELPLAVKPEYFFCNRVLVSEIRQEFMLISHILFHLLLFIESPEELAVDSIKVIVSLRVKARVTRGREVLHKLRCCHIVEIFFF